MHHYRCQACGFRVLSDQQAETVTVAQRHHSRRHEEEPSLDSIEAALTEVTVANDSADEEDDSDDLGPVFSDGHADEW